jgi:hypothetical protein
MEIRLVYYDNETEATSEPINDFAPQRTPDAYGVYMRLADGRLSHLKDFRTFADAWTFIRDTDEPVSFQEEAEKRRLWAENDKRLG